MLYPSNYFRYVVPEGTSTKPPRLQQWWASSSAVQMLIPPGTNGWSGEWRDVPVVTP